MLNKKILAATVAAAALGSSFSPISEAYAYNNNVLSCAGYSVEIKDSSSGLIGGVNLSISEPQVIAMDTNASCAVVVWNTNYISTSQVIFAKEGESRKLDILDSSADKFWGYSRGSEQNNDPQQYHIMIIKGLETGSTYYLRAVSRPHEFDLPFISKEIKFVFTEASSGKQVTDKNTSSTKSSKQGTVTVYSPEYQIKAAQNINRTIAPAHSEGKFVSTDADKKTWTQISNQKTQEEKKNENANANVNVQDSWANELAKDVFGSSTNEAAQEDELVDVISASAAAESSKDFWSKIWSWLKGVFGFGVGGELKEDESNQKGGKEEEKPESEQVQDGVIVGKTQENQESQQDELILASKEVKISSALQDKQILGLKSEDVKDIEDVPAGSEALEQGTSSAAAESKEVLDTKIAEGLDNLANATVAGSNKIMDFVNALGILALILPVLLILGALYIIQNILVQFDKLQSKKLAYWLSSFAIFAALFMFLKVTPLALVFLALFLIALAWHLFNVAVSDIDTDNQDVEVEKNEN